MTQVKRPARLDITDMPRDPHRVLGGLRKMLCATFNYTRKYPAKLTVFKETLKYVYNRVSAYEKELAEYNEKLERAEIERTAQELGIKVDGRKTVDDMRKELEAGKVKLEQAEKEPSKEPTKDEKPKAK